MGSEVKFNHKLMKETVNDKGLTIEGLLRHIFNDFLTFGGFAFKVTKNLGGEVTNLYYVDYSKLRSSKMNVGAEKDYVYLADEWGYGTKAFKIPQYNEYECNSILYYRGDLTRGTYPQPIYGAALAECEVERMIGKMHLNNLANGLSSSAVIAFCNGQPSDEQKEEIERGINDKFTGYENAGRVMLTYSDGKDTAPVVQTIDTPDWSEKYQALTKRSTQQIFLAFGLNPIVVGLEPDATGWAKTEYVEAYKLYMNTRVKQLREEVIRAFEQVLGKDCLSFVDKVEQVNTEDNESTVD